MTRKLGIRIGAVLLSTVAPALAHSAPVLAATGTTYFLSCHGNDRWAGTSESTPWRSLGHASDAVLVPGDRLLLERGCVWNGGRLDASWQGTPDQPIRISNYGTGAKPVLKNGYNTNVKVTGSYLIIDGLVSDFDPKNVMACGQSLGTFYGFNFTGGATGNLLRNSVAMHGTAGVHLASDSSSNRVTGNVLANNNVMTTWGQNASLDLGAWGVLIDSDNNEIADNEFRDNTATCRNNGYKLMSNSVEVYEGSNNWIHHNTSIGDRVFSEIGSSADVVSSGNVYEYNTFISDLADSRFITTRGGAAAFGPVLATTVTHNSTYQTGTGSEAIICGGNCTSDILTATNNVLWAEEKVIYLDGPATLGPNVIWNSTGTPTVQYSGQTPAGADQIITTNPGYRNPARGNLKLSGTPAAITPTVGA